METIRKLYPDTLTGMIDEILTSWKETHFHFSYMIMDSHLKGHQITEETEDKRELHNAVNLNFYNMGIDGLWRLADRLTDEFEYEYRVRRGITYWKDGKYLKTIQERFDKANSLYDEYI